MRSPLLSSRLGLCDRFPKYYRQLLLPLVASRMEGKSLLLKTALTLDTESRDLRTGTDRKTSSLMWHFKSLKFSKDRKCNNANRYQLGMFAETLYTVLVMQPSGSSYPWEGKDISNSQFVNFSLFIV